MEIKKYLNMSFDWSQSNTSLVSGLVVAYFLGPGHRKHLASSEPERLSFFSLYMV